jgi:hypothetical protein
MSSPLRGMYAGARGFSSADGRDRAGRLFTVSISLIDLFVVLMPSQATGVAEACDAASDRKSEL